MEDIVEYKVVIRKAAKNLYFTEVTMDGITTTSQALGIGQAMMRASDFVFSNLENEGRVK